MKDDPNFHRDVCVGVQGWYLPRLGGGDVMVVLPLAISDEDEVAFICLCSNCLNSCRLRLDVREPPVYRYFASKQALRKHVIDGRALWCGASGLRVRSSRLLLRVS